MSAASVVVTGATGFVGRHVVADLLDRGAAVTAVVRRADATLPAAVRQVTVAALEAPDAGPRLRDALRAADSVVHLAGRAHLDRAGGAMAEYRRAHVDATRALLAATVDSGVRRVVVVSTVAAALGDDGGRVDDTVSAAPTTPYGLSKREMELALHDDEATRGGRRIVTLRPPLVYGPGMKGNPLRLMKLVARGIPVPVSVPAARRSVLAVSNLAQAIGLALTSDALDTRPYFVSDGAAPTTVEFVEAMARALRVRARIVPVPRVALAAAGRLGDLVAKVAPAPLTTYEVRRLTATVDVDSGRFWRTVRATPSTSLDAAMTATAAWFQSLTG